MTLDPSDDDAEEPPLALGFLPEVYDRLRAFVRLRMTEGDRGIDATEIVHEVYLKLDGQLRAQYRDSVHFFAVAAQAVRRILVDHARRRASARRGGDLHRTTLDSGMLGDASHPLDVLDLDAALVALAEEEPRCAQLVELRFFGGLTLPEVATQLGVSTATAERDWRYARAFLLARIEVP